MSNNYTSEHDSTYSSDILELIGNQLILNVHFVLAFTLAALIYGAISWFMLVKFRNYRNYVFLNLTLANFFACTIIFISLYNLDYKRKIWFQFQLTILYLLYFFSTARHHWLLVISHMFYVDFVNVFKGHTQRRYLKSSLFAWGVPFLLTIFRVMCDHFLPLRYNYFYTVTLFLPLTLNCIFYIIIVYSLFRSSKASANTAAGTWRRLYISTLIFILCDVTLMSNYIANMIAPRFSQITSVLLIIVQYFTILVLDVFLVVVRSNRQLWYEFYIHKLNQRSAKLRDRDIIMPEKYISKPDHQQV